jgi:hypothetical protein
MRKLRAARRGAITRTERSASIAESGFGASILPDIEGAAAGILASAVGTNRYAYTDNDQSGK